jgi:hypothetical protein
VGVAGRVLAERLNADGFDYVAYDSSPIWDPRTARLSQREVVYLPGPLDHEFVVMLDRLEVPAPDANEKIWKIWVPSEPVFVNGTASVPRPGKWTSTDTDLLQITNQQEGLKTANYESGPTHGRLFLKTLAPAAVVNVLGGPGQEFQSGDDDGTTPWGAPQMTAAMHEYLGWGRIEVRPREPKAYDVFLHVMQVGDARSLRAMAPAVRVTSADGSMIGTHVGDAANHWVVLFGQAPADPAAGVAQATYSFRPGAPVSRHLLVNMKRDTTFTVTASRGGDGTVITIGPAGAGGVAVRADGQGVLTFTVNDVTVRAGAATSVPGK